jgi:glucosamine--fructose-6-phosphate aminotransferase (isomerizing)
VTLLDDEIREQPAVAARLLDAVLPRLPELGALLRSRGAEQVLLVARGSSDNAARYAQYLWQSALGVPVSLATPSVTTVYGRTPDLRRQAVVAVSQSGASPDVVAVVEQARAQGRPTLAVTNVPGSPLGGAAEEVLDLGAGPERSVAATKTYTASLLAAALLRVALDDRPDPTLTEELRRVPEALRAALDGVTGVEEAAVLLAGHDRAVCVGRGLHLATAHETALKVTELTGCLVAPYSPADLLHGPVAAVGAQVPAVLVAPPEPASASVLETAPDLRRRGAPVLVVGRAGDPLPDGCGRVGLPSTADLPGWLTPVTAVLPAQLVARRAAGLRGVDVDRPGDLTKVTRTR